MFAFLTSLLLGCTVQYAYAEPPATTYYTHTAVVPAPVVVQQYRRWVPGHYTPRGMWVSGYWTYAPAPRPYYAPPNCHVHRDGRSHCSRHQTVKRITKQLPKGVDFPLGLCYYITVLETVTYGASPEVGKRPF